MITIDIHVNQTVKTPLAVKRSDHVGVGVNNSVPAIRVVLGGNKDCGRSTPSSLDVRTPWGLNGFAKKYQQSDYSILDCETARRNFIEFRFSFRSAAFCFILGTLESFRNHAPGDEKRSIFEAPRIYTVIYGISVATYARRLLSGIYARRGNRI